jgi:hypothetical protein
MLSAARFHDAVDATYQVRQIHRHQRFRTRKADGTT